MTANDPKNGARVLRDNTELRDWFAGQALIGLIAQRGGSVPWGLIATAAYAAADAMLAEGRQSPTKRSE